MSVNNDNQLILYLSYKNKINAAKQKFQLQHKRYCYLSRTLHALGAFYVQPCHYMNISPKPTSDPNWEKL